MPEVLVLSGKGGTGKTTVAGSLIALVAAKAYADCDVNAPDLKLIVGSFTKEYEETSFGMGKAVIDGALCTKCGKCREVCRFDAIVEGNPYRVDGMACEGCTYCAHVCPVGAVSMHPSITGTCQLFIRGDERFSTAELALGSGNTGKLVTEVKRHLKERAPKGKGLVILDGSPGIGCPVIASLSGVDFVLMVAEPSISGISDLKRVVADASQMRVPMAIVINKQDVNIRMSARIEAFCQAERIPFLGAIPYDATAVEAANCGRTLVSYDCPAATAIRTICKRMIQLLEEMDRQ
jgi:MinD superfamily P-loop ATPase